MSFSQNANVFLFSYMNDQKHTLNYVDVQYQPLDPFTSEREYSYSFTVFHCGVISNKMGGLIKANFNEWEYSLQ